jgi:hypothetical protein
MEIDRIMTIKDKAIFFTKGTLTIKTMGTAKLEIIWLADQISSTIWKAVVDWDYFSKNTVGNQLVRAADSISGNLNEGIGRFHYADRKRFAYIARGSLYETINW